MRIEVPRTFWHVGDLSPRFASNDPRAAFFNESRVDIDMRACQFIRPAAVLWCAVYSLLSLRRGAECRILVPENMGVCVYLQSAGLFDMLKEAGVEIDDRGIGRRPDPQIVLPLTKFEDSDGVERLANDCLDSLAATGLGSPNLYPVVSEIFAELALNVVQHAESPIGGLGLIQFYEYESSRRFVCAVADGGIGIRKSLERNPSLRERVPYDWVAIELALRERVSGTGDATRGIGLYGVAEDMRKAGRQLIISSGLGMLETSEEVESTSKRTTLFPGTLAYAAIPS